MISLEKIKILTPLQTLPKNVGDLGKLIVAKGFDVRCIHTSVTICILLHNVINLGHDGGLVVSVLAIYPLLRGSEFGSPR